MTFFLSGRWEFLILGTEHCDGVLLGSFLVKGQQVRAH